MAGFNIPNEVDASFSDQSEPHSRDFDILALGYGLTGVISGGAVTAQGSPDNTAAVGSGRGISAGAYVSWTAGNVAMSSAADVTNPRFDLVSVSNAGVKTWTAGTAGTNPTPPAIPAGNIPLSVVYVPANDNLVNTTQIIDKRLFLSEKASPYVVVAASDAPTSIKAVADFVCDGIDDRANFTSAVGTGNKQVLLSEGNFVFASVWSDQLKSNLALIGPGRGTATIKLANGANSRLIENTNANIITNVIFANITLDGNKINQTDGASRDLRSIAQLTSITGLILQNIETKNGRSGASFRFYNCKRIYESGCYFHDNGLRAVLSGVHTLPVGTITVDDTTGYASAGKISLGGGPQIVTYTGKTGTTFTGCTGGTGTFASGTYVYPVTNDANQFLLISDATFHGSCTDLRVIGNHYENNTDTGTAMDGVVSGVVAGNVYRNNALGVGVGFSNAETGGAADCSEALAVGPNVIVGLNQVNHECQGIKVGSFGNTGDGGNCRKIAINQNLISLCDRSLWLDDLDDGIVESNVLYDAAGPNKQLILLAAGAADINGLRIVNNKLKNTNNRGISFDTGAVAGVEIYFNNFDTVTTPWGGTIPSDTRFFGNKGVGETDPQITALNFVVDGGGAAITTGVKGFVMVPFACTVTGWRLTADVSGSIVFDVWRDTFANYPPTVADTIAGSEKPTLASVAKNEDVSLTTWTTALAQGDWLGFNVDSATTVQRVTLVLLLKRIG